MRKIIFVTFLFFLLLGLSGCKASRATLKTDTETEFKQQQVTTASHSEQSATSEQAISAIVSNESSNVVIEFEEWEYYPAASDTITGGNYAHNSADYIHDDNGEADKPPNAGALKKHRKGTVTVNSEKNTEQNSQQNISTETESQTDESTETETGIKAKEKAESVRKSDGSSWRVWISIGLVCAVLLIFVGRDIARRANR